MTFRDMDIEFEGGAAADKPPREVKAPGVDARRLPAWGFYARNVENLTFQDVRLTCTKPDQRPVMICEDVNDLTLDTFRFPRFDGVSEPVVLQDVGRVRRDDTSTPSDGSR